VEKSCRLSMMRRAKQDFSTPLRSFLARCPEGTRGRNDTHSLLKILNAIALPACPGSVIQFFTGAIARNASFH
jgi:hypothetical protein